MKHKESNSMISDVVSYRAILKYIFEAYVLTVSSDNKITLVAVPLYIFFSSRLVEEVPTTASFSGTLPTPLVQNCLSSCAVNFITETTWVKNNL